MKGFSANGRVINYGLLGIKNLGTDFIDDIIKERRNGRYKDFLISAKDFRLLILTAARLKA